MGDEQPTPPVDVEGLMVSISDQLQIPLDVVYRGRKRRDVLHELLTAAFAEVEKRHAAELQTISETAWLAERIDVQPPTYVTVSDIGFFELTPDPNKAIRFKRMEDARQMAGLFELEDVRAREHSWPEVGNGKHADAAKG